MGKHGFAVILVAAVLGSAAARTDAAPVELSGLNPDLSGAWQGSLLNEILGTGLSGLDAPGGLGTGAAVDDGYWAEVEVEPGIFAPAPGYPTGPLPYDINSAELAPIVAFLTNPALPSVEATLGYVEPSLDARIPDAQIHAPEPASLLLLGTGLVFAARRLRSK